MAETKPDVGTPTEAHKTMMGWWHLPLSLMGGTEEMRRQRTRYLPQEPKEDDADYNNRIARSVLFNAFGDTVGRLEGKPFIKDVILKGTVPGWVRELEADMDGDGRSLTELAREAFREALVGGMSLFFTDSDEAMEGETKAEEIAAGRRRTIIRISPTNLIGARHRTVDEEGGGARQVLSQIRIREIVEENHGDYDVRDREWIRVYSETGWELWKRRFDDEMSSEARERYVKVREGSHTFGGIPLDPFYIRRVGRLMSRPPLEDLAWMNLAHWQSMSDQRNYLRFIRLGILFAAGWTQEEIDDGLVVSPNKLVGTTNKDGSLSYVETEGKAAEVGQIDIDRLEDRMERFGLQPELRRSGSTTATGRVLDEARATTDILAWIQSLELTLRDTFATAGKWTGDTLPEDFEVSIFSEFSVGERSTDDAKMLLEARAKKEIDHGTFIEEWKARGTLSEDVDAEEVKAKLDEEVAAMPSFGLGEDDEPEGGEETDGDNEPAGQLAGAAAE